MRKLTVAAALLGLAVGGLLTPAVASAACVPPNCSNTVASGTLTLSIQSGTLTGVDAPTRHAVDSGQLTLRGDGNEWSIQSGRLTLGGAAYAVQSGTLTLSEPDGVEYRITSGTLTLGGVEYRFEALGFDALGFATSGIEY